ncbi:hypothetical protein ACFRCG_00790 [Embleya sp. NPDC056575]|uniref:hypothetical protein n=1 Tax=unclassified Embleya TaxID=2699296 RepID=UPI0036BC9B3A
MPGQDQQDGADEHRAGHAQRQPRRIVRRRLVEGDTAEHGGEQRGHRGAHRHDQRRPAPLQRGLGQHQTGRAGADEQVRVGRAKQFQHPAAGVVRAHPARDALDRQRTHPVQQAQRHAVLDAGDGRATRIPGPAARRRVQPRRPDQGRQAHGQEPADRGVVADGVRGPERADHHRQCDEDGKHARTLPGGGSLAQYHRGQHEQQYQAGDQDALCGGERQGAVDGELGGESGGEGE